ncbi:MAP2 isoform 8, partial [Pan troglodytes]
INGELTSADRETAEEVSARIVQVVTAEAVAVLKGEQEKEAQHKDQTAALPLAAEETANLPPSPPPSPASEQTVTVEEAAGGESALAPSVFKQAKDKVSGVHVQACYKGILRDAENSTLSKIPALQGSTKSPRYSSACPSTTKRATFSDSLLIQPTSAGSTDRLPYSKSGNKDGVTKSPEKRSSLPRPSSILPPRRGVSGDRDENSFSL